MKKLIVLILLVSFSATFGGLSNPKFRDSASKLETLQTGFIELANVTTDDTALTASTRTWSKCVTDFNQIPENWNTMSFQFYGYGDGDGAGDPENTTFTATIYFVSWFGCAQQVAILTGTIGAVQISNNPAKGAFGDAGAAFTTQSNYKMADTLAITAGSEKWYYTGRVTDGLGADGVSSYDVDAYGACGVRVIITGMALQNVTNVVCIATGR
jgi:hypothetical protein